VAEPIPGVLASTGPPWRLKAEAVNVENVALDYTDRSRATPLTLAVGGLNILLNASAEVGAGPANVTVDGLKVKMNRVAFSETGDNIPLIAVDTLALDHGRIDMGTRSVKLTRVGAAGGGICVVRGKDGRIQLAEMLAPGDRGKLKREIVETGEKARSEGKPWSFRLDAFELNGFNAVLQDHTIDPAVAYDLKDIRVSLKHLTNDGKTPIDFDAQLKVAQGGSARFTGQVSQTGDHAEAQASIVDVNLKPLHPALAKFTWLALESGNLTVSGRMKYQSGRSGPQLRASGSISLDSLRINQTDTGERFLEWKAMSANGLKFGLSPHGLQIQEVRLLEPGAKIVIFKDRSVNLAKMIKSPEVVDVEETSHPTQAPAVAPVVNRTLFPVSIDRVHVEKGVVDFADLSLLLPFAAQITDLNGGVTGISSDPASRASVALDGNVDEYGLATVRGRLSPFMPKTFTDIIVSFRNVEMKPLSSYSATFAGRKIASGTLSLNLGYKIQNSELFGDNQVVLEQFTLGERVEAPNAINLPLDLAIALLTDAQGKIDVAVPVQGNLENPEFKYGHVIRQAFINLITKIVTAPFRALGGLFGGKSDQMDVISFYPGSDRLLPPELKKLKNVVEALKKRPRLKLVVQGRFDPKLDGEALRTQRVKRALAVQMGVTLAPNEEFGPIAFENAKTQRALEKLLERRGSDNAVAHFKTHYEKVTGEKAKRVNSTLAFFGMESPDTAFYRAMFKELVTLEPVTDTNLLDLARRRAEAIVSGLKTSGGLATRVTAGSSGPVEEASTETVNARLTLEAIKPSS
jgi:outer membrane protein OmpA-like peptidoglycan-associated protein